MQLSQQNGHTIERVLTTPKGLVRAVFFVYESHGRIRARLISAELIAKAKALATRSISLPQAYIKTAILPLIRSVFSSIATPSTIHHFFTSQPTRAPSISY